MPDRDDDREHGRPISGERLLNRYGIPQRGVLSRAPRTRGTGGHASGRPAVQAVGDDPRSATPAPQSGPATRRRATWGWALAVVIVAVVIAAVLLAVGNDDDAGGGGPRVEDAKLAAPSAARPLTVGFQQLKRGRQGRATLTVTPVGGGSARMTIRASVPGTQYEVSLVKERGSSKRLMLGRDGDLTYNTTMNLAALARRYDAFEVLALSLPRRAGHGRARSLRLSTMRLTQRLLEPR